MESLCQLVALSLQQSGVDSWQCALLSIERGLLVLDVKRNRNGLCVRVRVHNPGLGQVHLVARCKHMFSNHRGQHIPLPQCSMMLPKALLQGPSSLPDVTPRALVTRDGVDHSLSLQLWNRVLGVDQLLPECPKWTESDPDVQVAEHSADGLGQPTDVWDSYGCSCCLG